MTYSKKCRSKGLTLIEVVACIGLLSTLLVMMLSIHSRHVRQINLAFEKQTSADLLDTLLAGWFATDERFPVDATGGFPDNKDYFWRTSVVPSTATNLEWAAKTIRVDVVSVKTNESLTSVELVDSIAGPARQLAPVDRDGG